MGRFKGKRLAVLMAAILTIGQVNVAAAGSGGFEEKDSDEVLKFGLQREGIYAQYIEEYSQVNGDVKTIVVDGSDMTDQLDGAEVLGTYEGREGVLLVEDNTAVLDFEVTVPEDGLYTMAIDYYPLNNKNRQVEMAVMIDGELPFDEADDFAFSKAWENDGSIIQDSRGNDMKPKQVQVMTWLEEAFMGRTGNYNAPFQFYLSKGVHRITLDCYRAGLAVDGVTFQAQRDIPDYASYTSMHSGAGDVSEFEVRLQGEHADLKSDPALTPIYNRSDPLLEPYDATQIKLNTIGALNWQYPEQWISWQLDVPEDGYYKIGVKFKQNFLRGLFTSRQLRIDGEVPFKEVEHVKFYFDSHWNIQMMGDDSAYEFYLEKGTHDISLRVTTGEMANTIKNVEDAVYQLNFIYRKMLMVTGPDPDKFRDYYLEREIPELLDTFAAIRQSLVDEKAKLEAMSGQGGSEAVILETLAIQLESFVDEPSTIPVRMKTYKDNISALSAWMLRLKEQPLEIDYLLVQSLDMEKPKVEAGFFLSLINSIKAFFASFTADYSVVGDVDESEEAITVWVSMGRDQVQIVKQMVDDHFTPQTGIPVNVNLVQQGLVQATLAGKGPDIALFVPGIEPVNLAARGALMDLTQFEDFDKVASRFQPYSNVPYQYEGGQYALPVTQSFMMMFYRKDIFEELNIEPPRTWDDMYDIIPKIQRKHMEIGLPAIAVNPGAAGVANNSVFDTLLFQNGGVYYNEERSATGFDSPEALTAFKQWTEFYARYGFPMEYDFYSRFRTGEMPVAIDSYVMYNKLAVGAPEIKNLWEMIPIPGTVREDGSIDSTAVGGGLAGVVFEKTENKEGAWEFMKWFTSAEIQSEFGINIESLMGPAARYDTANTEAMSQLPWTQKELDKLMEQRKQVREVPQIPASYYVFRNVYNAFRSVKFKNTNPREALFIYNKEMNSEILRKRIEFGLEEEQ